MSNQLCLLPSDVEIAREWLEQHVDESTVSVLFERKAGARWVQVAEFSGDDLHDDILSDIDRKHCRIKGQHRLRVYWGKDEEGKVRHKRKSVEVVLSEDAKAERPDAQLARSQEQTTARVLDRLDRLDERLDAGHGRMLDVLTEQYESRLDDLDESATVHVKNAALVAALKEENKRLRDDKDPQAEKLRTMLMAMAVINGMGLLGQGLTVAQLAVAKRLDIDLGLDGDTLRETLFKPRAQMDPRLMMLMLLPENADPTLVQGMLASLGGGTPGGEAGGIDLDALSTLIEHREAALERRVLAGVRKELQRAREERPEERPEDRAEGEAG